MTAIEVIFGSTSDEEKVLPGIVQATKENPGLEVRVHYASADNTPEKVRDLMNSYLMERTPIETRGFFDVTRQLGRVIISGAGLSNVLTGFIKSRARINDLVIGIPIDDSISRGLTSLLSTMEKPPMNPVLAVGINNSYAAVQIANRFEQGLSEVVIPAHDDLSLIKKFDELGMPYKLVDDDFSPDSLVVRTIQNRIYRADIDDRLKKGKGVQLVVSRGVIGYEDYLHLLDKTSVTGMVGSMSYENAVYMAAILTRNHEVLKKMDKLKSDKAEKLRNHKGLLVVNGEVKKL